MAIAKITKTAQDDLGQSFQSFRNYFSFRLLRGFFNLLYPLPYHPAPKCSTLSHFTVSFSACLTSCITQGFVSPFVSSLPFLLSKGSKFFVVFVFSSCSRSGVHRRNNGSFFLQQILFCESNIGTAKQGESLIPRPTLGQEKGGGMPPLLTTPHPVLLPLFRRF